MRTLVAVSLALIAGAPCLAGVDEGIVAYRIGHYATAIQELEAAAGKGDVTARLVLGVMRYRGKGLDQDIPTSVSDIRFAAEHGNPIAQCMLGAMYYSGHGVERDYSAAALWYQKAADQDVAEAALSLSDMYKDGEGVERDAAKAEAWQRKRRGFMGSAYVPELCPEIPEPERFKEIEVALREAAVQRGDPEELRRRAMDYYNPGPEQDYAKAAEWFLKAAERGQVDAQFALGTMYLEGQGVPRDPDQSMFWLCRASEQWDLVAIALVLRMYINRGDWPNAYMYLRVGMLGENPQAAEETRVQDHYLDEKELADGRKLVEEFLAKFPRPADAARRNRYEWH